jgi:hypothetical protein
MAVWLVPMLAVAWAVFLGVRVMHRRRVTPKHITMDQFHRALDAISPVEPPGDDDR